MPPKKADSKGRVSLGARFANQMVIVKEMSATQAVVTIAAIVPADEAWLHRNKRAKSAVMRGIAQAAKGELNAGPNLRAGAKLSKRIG